MQQQPSLKAGLRRVPVVLAAAMLALLVPVSAASAHDSLTGTNPAADQTVEKVPDGIKLKFSNTPLAMGSEVIVEDPAGNDWAVGDVEIADNMVTQPINPDAPSGELYKVTWRVVSSDSHPIEGTFTFTAAAGGNGPESSTTTEQDSASSGSDEAEASNGFPTGLVAGMAAVLIVLVIIIAMIARRRLNHNGRD